MSKNGNSESWDIVEEKKVYENFLYQIIEQRIRRPDGSRGTYYILKKDPGVAIVPFDGRNIYLVEQYRPTFRKRMWEVPAGKSDGRALHETAKKELKEETGFAAKTWKELGEFACGPGHTDHIGMVFLAMDLVPGDHEREHSEQDMRMEGFSVDRVFEMIRSGEIIDSWTLTSLFLFRLSPWFPD